MKKIALFVAILVVFNSIQTTTAQTVENKYYYAGTWSDHSTLIQTVPRRYNVPCDQTRFLFSYSPEGSYKPLVADYEFCLCSDDWDIINGTLYQENDTTYFVFVHKWTQFIDGTMNYMPLSKCIRSIRDLNNEFETAWNVKMLISYEKM